MPKLKIRGSFRKSTNNYLRIELYQSGPQGYDFSKKYYETFDESLNDLPVGSYNLDFTGYTTGKLSLKVTGDISKSIDKEFEDEPFELGFRIKVK